MGRNPFMLYTDGEGSFNSKEANKFDKGKHIKHIITRGHANYGERAIRTIKQMIYKRIDKMPNEKWYSHNILYNALFTYNYKMKNVASGMTPSDAKKTENILQVKANLEMHRVKNENILIYTLVMMSGYILKRNNLIKSVFRSGLIINIK